MILIPHEQIDSNVPPAPIPIPQSRSPAYLSHCKMCMLTSIGMPFMIAIFIWDLGLGTIRYHIGSLSGASSCLALGT